MGSSRPERPRAATGPITITAGGSSSTPARPASVVRTNRSAGSVPRAITATGVSGARPPLSRASATASRVVIPMRTTRVPPARASASQSGPAAPAVSPTRPVTTVTDEARPRWVTGIPSAAGTPKAEVTPGTTSQSMPAALEDLGLLAAPAEEERIAALETHHGGRASAVLHQEPPDLVLAVAGRVGHLAHVDQLGRGRHEI